jgi:perosamine synthetase
MFQGVKGGDPEGISRSDLDRERLSPFAMRDNIRDQFVGPLISFLPSGGIIYTFSGRNALWLAIRIMGLSSGSEILAPSYNCGAEITPMLKSGLTVRLYRITDKLEIDFDDLKKAINQDTRALLVTHYFGFPQPVDRIRAICDDNNLFLIEDCAHALWSTYNERPLGSYGDVSLFSFRKFLSVPDGGALAINNGQLKMTERLIPPPLTSEVRKLITLSLLAVKNKVADVLPTSVRHSLHGATTSSNGPALSACDDPSNIHYNYHLNLDRVNWAMSKASRFIIKRISENDGENIIKKRRQNFEILSHEFEGSTTMKMLYDELPGGVCPSFFPVIVKERDRTHDSLLKKGIFTFKTWQCFHPGLSWDAFPEALFLKNHVLSFPIHHRTDRSDMIRMAEAMKKVT